MKKALCPKCETLKVEKLMNKHIEKCKGRLIIGTPCENCKTPILEKYTKYGVQRFCSEKCSKAYSTINKRLRNQKFREKRKINNCCEFCGKGFENPSTNRFCSNSCGAKATVQRNQHLGGWNSKKRIDYLKRDGIVIHLQSSYEEKVAKALDENGINWTRPSPFFYIKEDDSRHRYYPDFHLTDFNVYLDPKASHLIEIDREKIEMVASQNDVKIFILTSEELDWNSILTKISTTNLSKVTSN